MEIIIDRPSGYVGGDHVRGELRIRRSPSDEQGPLSATVCFVATQHVCWDDEASSSSAFEEVDLHHPSSESAAVPSTHHEESEEFVTKEFALKQPENMNTSSEWIVLPFEVLLPQFSYATHHSPEGHITYMLTATTSIASGMQSHATLEVPVLGSCDPISVENFAGVPSITTTRPLPHDSGELTAKGTLFKSWFHPCESVAAMLDLENFPSPDTPGAPLTRIAATLMQHQRYRSCNGNKLQSVVLVSETNDAPLEPGFKECRLVSLSLPDTITATIKGSLVTIEYSFDLILYSNDSHVMTLSFPITIFPRKSVHVPTEFLYRNEA